MAALAAGGVWAQTIDEYQVKAAFLYNFAKFVDWPPEVFHGPADPISICLLGGNPFGRMLEEAVGGKSVGGRVFTVHQIDKIGQVAGCKVLYIAGSRKRSPEETMAGLLTVGEAEGFAASGGVIGFKLDGGKVRLEINVQAAEQRKLRISSKLLSLAQIVRTDR
jgi:hypothetical protein